MRPLREPDLVCQAPFFLTEDSGTVRPWACSRRVSSIALRSSFVMMESRALSSEDILFLIWTISCFSSALVDRSYRQFLAHDFYLSFDGQKASATGSASYDDIIVRVLLTRSSHTI